jgi:hypothetical protein
MSTVETPLRIRLENILFATDFSTQSERALQFALAFAKQHSAKIIVVHAAPPEPHYAVPMEPIPLEFDPMLRESKQQMQELAANPRLHAVSHECIVEQGDLWNVVDADLAKYRTDPRPSHAWATWRQQSGIWLGRREHLPSCQLPGAHGGTAGRLHRRAVMATQKDHFRHRLLEPFSSRTTLRSLLRGAARGAIDVAAPFHAHPAGDWRRHGSDTAWPLARVSSAGSGGFL